MKVTKTINKAENVTAVDFGKLSNLNDYVLELAPEVKIPGKVFDTAAQLVVISHSIHLHLYCFVSMFYINMLNFYLFSASLFD